MRCFNDDDLNDFWNLRITLIYIDKWSCHFSIKNSTTTFCRMVHICNSIAIGPLLRKWKFTMEEESCIQPPQYMYCAIANNMLYIDTVMNIKHTQDENPPLFELKHFWMSIKCSGNVHWNPDFRHCSLAFRFAFRPKWSLLNGRHISVTSFLISRKNILKTMSSDKG